MYLRKEHQESLANLLNSSLWADIKRCLQQRRPESPVSGDLVHVAAAKGFERKGYEQAISDIEILPFDQPVTRADPFDRPSVNATED